MSKPALLPWSKRVFIEGLPNEIMLGLTVWTLWRIKSALDTQEIVIYEGKEWKSYEEQRGRLFSAEYQDLVARTAEKSGKNGGVAELVVVMRKKDKD